MIGLNVRTDLKAVERDLNRVQKQVVPKLAAQALNRTNRGIRTDIVRALSGGLNIKPAKRVRRRILIPKGRDFVATAQRLRAGGLFLFQYVPEIYTLKGARAKKQAQGPNRFLADMPNGHLGLFRRKSKSRLPISEFLVDLSPRAESIIDQLIQTKGAERWKKEADRLLIRALKR